MPIPVRTPPPPPNPPWDWTVAELGPYLTEAMRQSLLARFRSQKLSTAKEWPT